MVFHARLPAAGEALIQVCAEPGEAERPWSARMTVEVVVTARCYNVTTLETMPRGRIWPNLSSAYEN